MKYVKRHETVDAFQWTGCEIPVPEEFASMGYMEHENGYDLEVDTVSGGELCRLNDYLVRDSKGFHIVGCEAFKDIYEPSEIEKLREQNIELFNKLKTATSAHTKTIGDLKGLKETIAKSSGLDLAPTEPLKYYEYLTSGDIGISSRTMFCAIMGIENNNSWCNDIPHDPADFGRCYRLIERFPEFEAQLYKVSVIKGWAPFIMNWGRMKELYLRDLPTGKCAELYELMQELRK